MLRRGAHQELLAIGGRFIRAVTGVHRGQPLTVIVNWPALLKDVKR
jgi:hypothetical protein